MRHNDTGTFILHNFVWFIYFRGQSVEGLHKEDAGIRPCMFAVSWDNLCRLLYLMPPSFLCTIVHRWKKKKHWKHNKHDQKWLVVFPAEGQRWQKQWQQQRNTISPYPNLKHSSQNQIQCEKFGPSQVTRHRLSFQVTAIKFSWLSRYQC